MKTTFLRTLSLATVALAALLTAPAMAQLSVDVTGDIDSNLKIAVPPMPAQQEADTPAGSASVGIFDQSLLFILPSYSLSGYAMIWLTSGCTALRSSAVSSRNARGMM